MSDLFLPPLIFILPCIRGIFIVFPFISYMPLLCKKRLSEDVCLGLWALNEDEDFFFETYPHLVSLKQAHINVASKQRRLEKLATAALLFEIIGRADLSFKHDANGKPLLEGYHASISHTKGMVALMLSCNSNVAVDVEYVSDRVGRVAHKFVNAEEDMPTNMHLLLAWCAKEATFKYFSDDKLSSSEINLQPFAIEEHGTITALNLKRKVSVCLRYSLLADFVLVYAF